MLSIQGAKANGQIGEKLTSSFAGISSELYERNAKAGNVETGTSRTNGTTAANGKKTNGKVPTLVPHLELLASQPPSSSSATETKSRPL